MSELPVGPVPPSTGSNVVTYVPVDSQAEWDSSTFNMSSVLGIFRRHVWVILGIAAVALGVTGVWLSREKTLYAASALIRLGDPRTQLAEALGTGGGGQTQSRVDPMASEVMVLQSPAVLEEAVKRQGLRLFSASTGEPAGFVQNARVDLPPDRSAELEVIFGETSVVATSTGRRAEAPYGEPLQVDGIQFSVSSRQSEPARLIVVPLQTATGYIEQGLSTMGVKWTNGVQVRFASTDPEIATRIVNAVVTVYQEVNVANATEKATRRREFLERQLRETDSLLTLAQAALGDLRGSTQTYSSAAKFAAEQGNLMQVELRREELKVNRRMYAQLLQALERSEQTGSAANLSALMSTPGVGTNPVISGLFSQLVGYQTARDEAITGAWAQAPTHPDVQRYEALIASAERRLVEALRSQIGALDAQIAGLGSLSGRAAGQMARLPGIEIQEVRLSDRVETLRGLSAQLRQSYETARMEEAVEGGWVEIVHLASAAIPVDSNAPIKLMMALVLGLLLGGGVAFIRDKMDSSINRPDEVDRLLQVPSLAVIPKIEFPSKKGFLKRLLPGANGRDEPRGSEAAVFMHGLDSEAFRILRTNVLFSPSANSLKTIVVTSAMPREGKTVTAANLAIACARQGLRTLLLDCDLRRPGVAEFFEKPQEPGLSNVLLEGQHPAEAIRPSGVEGLDVLPSAASPDNASELIGGSAMKRLLEEVSQRYDMVILDSPPVLLTADPAVLGATADGVLLVIRAGSTDQSAVRLATEQLTAVGAHVIGAVLNDPDSTVQRYGASYLQQFYYSYSEQE